MKILITGAAGFIGYHLCKALLEEGHKVIGVDNLNNYYSQDLKLARLDLLTVNKNFSFEKVDIAKIQSISSVFKKFKPNKVVNLAAQAGVRYSIKNPQAYVKSNILGFVNILELSIKNEVEGFIYASSSSVYGSNKKIPFLEKDQTDNPVSIYGASKKSNELIATAYHNLYGLKTTGLRYFTVYGPWGRPDMAYFIFTKKILANENISVFNEGKMKRDFTFIDDIIVGTKSAIEKNYNCEIFNLGNNKNEKLMDLISILENELSIKAKIKFLPMQSGDVKETYADLRESSKKLNFKPEISIYEGIPKFVEWYKDYFNV
ncbi:SDR family NAD(P)-dependent oxidoreductase [Candidatus Marinimicrobia bacterium]|nr:SDR family NAD(P)-dependent oxidoreductase [Candidatus Neomarinimicrobiota bacterium]